jgi:hypothetical protein
MPIVADDVVCPRCGASMVRRRKRATGEPFFGCSRFPDCRGTRPIRDVEGEGHRGAIPRSRYRLRLEPNRRYARNVPDVVELLIARRLGRNLRRWEGCLVQSLAIVTVIAVFYWFVASGTLVAITTELTRWYVSQIHISGAPTPSPTSLP